MSNDQSDTGSPVHHLVGQPCPFCGAPAFIYRELNCDTLSVSHLKTCFIKFGQIVHFHYNDPKKRPENPFSDWETRLINHDNEDVLNEDIDDLDCLPNSTFHEQTKTNP